MSIDQKNRLRSILDKLLITLAFSSFVSIFFLLGFYLDSFWNSFFTILSDIILIVFVVEEIIRFLIAYNYRNYLKSRRIEVSITILIIIRLILPNQSLELVSYLLPELNLGDLSLIFIVISQVVILFSIFIRILRYNSYLAKFNFHSGAIITISFVIVISIGTIFLMLPRMVLEDKALSFIDALFTSTSAVCVTGLVVVDTSSTFSPIGRIVLLTLIQIGGLGFMTLTTFIALVFAGGMSVRVKVFMKDLLSQESISEGAGLLKRILAFTFLVEALGTLLLYFSLGGNFFDFDRHLFYDSIFHSVSAFCNAGFSVYSDGLMFHSVSTNYLYLSTVMILVILGGIGFFPLTDMSRNIFKSNGLRKLKLSTKIVFITSISLILIGTLVFVVFEKDNTDLFNVGDRIFQSLFLSVITRTAGFNSINLEVLSSATIMFCIILMWIGASPGSTGGGIKTSTFALTLVTLLNTIRGKGRVEIFNKEISPENIKQAGMVIISSLIFLGLSTTLLVWFEKDIEPLKLIFEATSAISTVGLSLGITSSLGLESKIVIIALMFVGRIGVLTFFLSLHKPQKEPNYKLPYEKIMIG